MQYGQGRFIHPNGFDYNCTNSEKVYVYKGEWKKRKKHGIGKESWPTGDEYQGNFINDKKEGYIINIIS